MNYNNDRKINKLLKKNYKYYSKSSPPNHALALFHDATYKLIIFFIYINIIKFTIRFGTIMNKYQANLEINHAIPQ
jgi:hypothetical protein